MPTFDEVKMALFDCMTAEPPVNYMLSRDASALCTVFAEMLYFKRTEHPFDAFTPPQAEAYDRWAAGPCPSTAAGSTGDAT